jgi:hypothetical protein
MCPISTAIEPIYSFVYISASSHLLSDAELADILTVSRRNNTQVGITGMLLYYDGAFMQVLEGESAAIETVLARISQDKRHSRIIRLLEEYVPERGFPDWSMGYHRLNRADMTQREGFNELTDINQFVDYFQDEPQKSLVLLKSFLSTAKR